MNLRTRLQFLFVSKLDASAFAPSLNPKRGRAWWPQGGHAIGRRGWWVALMLLAWCSSASALNRDGPIADLLHTGWGLQSGAPSGNALAQTTDGYLWLGSHNGLFRFDGLKFQRLALPVAARNVFQLFASPTGGLWIGFVEGSVVFLKDGVVKTYTSADGLPGGSVLAFAESADGTVWVGTNGGLARLRNSRWERVGDTWHAPARTVFSLMVDSADTLWAAADRALFALPRNATTFQPVPVKTPDNFSFAEAPSGAIWVWDEGGIRQIAKNPNPSRRTANSGRNFVFDRDGGLWVKGDGADVRRLARPEAASGKPPDYEELRDRFDSKQGFAAGPGPTQIIEDREGNLWLFGHAGLDRFSERRLKPLHSEGTLTPVNTGLAPAQDGGIWLANRDTKGPARRFQDGKFTTYPAVVGASAVLTAADGSTWFGGVNGLWRHASGRLERVPVPPSMDKVDVQSMTDDAEGGLWVQFAKVPGLFRWADHAWTAIPGGDKALALYAKSLAIDAAGRVWSGGMKGRVAVLDHGEVKVFPRQEALQIGAVTAIYGRRKHIWAGGELGLARLDGDKFVSVLPEPGKEFSTITGIVETADGDLWLNGASGISHITAQQISLALADPGYRVKIEVLDQLDGYEGTGSRVRPVPTLVETRDGRLWFASSAGIYWLDPSKAIRNVLPPPVLVQSVIADGAAFPIKPGLTLPERTQSLQFDYVGLSLTQAERVRYRYRLEGFDASWQDAQSRRQAFYTNLSPGTYRFRVTATNNDGVWNDIGDSVQFTIPPAFVQTGWFVAMCTLLGAAVVWLMVRLRVRQLNARTQARFEAQIAERERIARELHDTLLQSTQGLIMKFQIAANRLPPDNPQRTLLKRSLDDADEVMAEARDRVMDLRLPSDSLTDLGDSFVRVSQDLARGGTVECRVCTTGPARKLRDRVKDEAYRIGREALINAFKHSQARSIQVLIAYGDEAFQVRVSDDGTGMEAATLEARARPGHWGLRGMHERADELGGRLEIRSPADGGTSIELTVPALLAYADRPLRARWAALFRTNNRH